MFKSEIEQQLNQINISNAEAIDKFFSWYGRETRAEFSMFLFDTLIDFVNKDQKDGYTNEYKDQTMLKLRMVNDLVQSLKAPEKESI